MSEQGFDYFYSSNMTRDMVEEINGLGGNYSVEDFANYSVIERNVTESSYAGFPLLSTPPPSAGAVLSMILSVLEGTSVMRVRASPRWQGVLGGDQQQRRGEERS